MNFLELARARFSCKKYDATPVSDEDLSFVLEAGRLAPTAKNAQPQHIYVLRSDEALAKVDALTPCRYGAPVVLLVTYNAREVYSYPGGAYTSGPEDIGIVGTHLALAAADTGLNSCWVNRFDPDQAHESFGLAEDEVAVMLLDLGHAAPDAQPLKNHESRKALAETVSYL